MNDLEQQYYVTTPLYYVNAKPHIGHAYTTVAADVLARFSRLMGRKTIFLTGTDEHGQKVEQASRKQAMTPEAFTDQLSQEFKDLWKLLDISYDDFIRTTEKRHVDAVRHVWRTLEEKGEISIKKYKGWYDATSESFLSYREFKDGGYEDNPRLREHLEEIEEENYFFHLSKHQGWLIEYIRSHAEFIEPVSRRNETLSFLENNDLADLCISRPKTRLKWGITCPLSDNHVTYVWFDALINYITAAGYPDMDKMSRNWPASVHLIGKDILRPHTVYWPIMLHALGLTPPRKVYAHGWWMVDAEKMSKSFGNVVNPVDVVQEYGVDVFRYFLMREVPFGQDGCYSDEAITLRYNVDLANNLGNLLNRTLTMLEKYCAGEVPDIATLPQNQLRIAVDTLPNTLDEALKKVHFHLALSAIWDVIDQANRYIEENAPWKLAKAGETERLRVVMRSLCETLRMVAHAIWPFIPSTAEKMWVQLGLPKEDLTSNAFYKRRWDYFARGHCISKDAPLFPRREK